MRELVLQITPALGRALLLPQVTCQLDDLFPSTPEIRYLYSGWSYYLSNKEIWGRLS